MSGMGLCALRLAYFLVVFGAVSRLAGVGTPKPSGNLEPMPISPGFLRPCTQGFSDSRRYDALLPMAFSLVAGPGFLADGVTP